MAMETYNGHVRTPTDAIILFEACRIGLLPRVQRRLSEKERQSIKSGSVFVWDEREAGMRRWTDGKSWSASRVSGSFLTYREMEGKRGGNSFDKTANRDGMTTQQENDSDGGGPDGYRYKPDGLMKQSFSITTNNNQHLHLISYFSRSSTNAHNLIQPSNDPQLRHIRPEKGMYPDATVHEQSNIPAVTRGPMNSPGYTHAPNQQPPYSRGPSQYYPHPGWAPPSPMHTPPPHNSYHHQPYYQQPPYHHGHYQPPPPPAGYGAPPPMSQYDRPPPHAGPPYGQGPPPPHSAYPPQYPPPQPYHVSGPGRFSTEKPADPKYQSSYSSYQHPPPQTSPYSQHSYEPRPPMEPQHAESYEKPRNDSHQEQKQPSPRSKAEPPPASKAQTIPSISAMLNGGESGPPPARNSSRSPGGTLRAPLQDIPSHKLGFEVNRDVQALRNLDKTTFKGY